jgi:hypothetical protein
MKKRMMKKLEKLLAHYEVETVEELLNSPWNIESVWESDDEEGIMCYELSNLTILLIENGEVVDIQ